jgi:hypothetical protein
MTILRSKEAVLLVEPTYTVTLTQIQLDILTELIGSVAGAGPIRSITDGMYHTFFKYATPHDDALAGNIFFSDPTVMLNDYEKIRDNYGTHSS